jgi:hypothetical protein
MYIAPTQCLKHLSLSARKVTPDKPVASHSEGIEIKFNSYSPE